MNDKPPDSSTLQEGREPSGNGAATALAAKAETVVNAVKGEPARAVKFAQKSFKDLFEQVSQEDHRIIQRKSIRFTVALILKGLAIFGGAVIGAGVFPEEYSRLLGGAIVGGTLLDLWLSNHSQLMTLEAAHGTYESLTDRVKAEHRLGLLREVLPLEGIDAARKLTDLCTRLVQLMETTHREVRDSIRKKRYQHLNNLALENRAKTPVLEE